MGFIRDYIQRLLPLVEQQLSKYVKIPDPPAEEKNECKIPDPPEEDGDDSGFYYLMFLDWISLTEFETYRLTQTDDLKYYLLNAIICVTNIFIYFYA